ncbi:MAG: hypothetical protein L6V81_04220 [Clostridium sp.]|nr:MAG: hypothetical protein L6V81_04220 [Clostridium sp.]
MDLNVILMIIRILLYLFGSIVSVRESYYDSNLELEIVDYADTKCNNKN